VVIIRCKIMLKAEQLCAVYDGLVEMAKNGVILLPEGFELLNEVPPDEEIVVIKKGEHHGDV